MYHTQYAPINSGKEKNKNKNQIINNTNDDYLPALFL